jgi:folylpolyglutamate synthase/dihydropteroate synthase
LLVFGAGTTHNPQELLAVLLPAGARTWMTRSRHAKATPVAELQEQAAALGHTTTSTETVAEALTAALAVAGEEDLVLVTGSLFVVAEAREAWAARHGLPAYPADPPGVY